LRRPLRRRCRRMCLPPLRPCGPHGHVRLQPTHLLDVRRSSAMCEDVHAGPKGEGMEVSTLDDVAVDVH
jgi:hypothetical protein